MIRINLLKAEPKEFRGEAAPAAAAPEPGARRTAPWGAAFFVLAAAAVGALFLTQRGALAQEQRLLDKAKEERTRLQYVSAKLAELEAQRAALTRRISLITYLQAKRLAPVRVLDEVSRDLPDWVWLTETSYNADSGRVLIRGRALSNNLIADYISSLEGGPVLMNVSNVSSNERQGGQNKNEFLEFSLTAVVEPSILPPPPAETAPAAKRRTR